MRVLIKNGLIVNADKRACADLLIDAGRVKQIASTIEADASCKVIDATGCYVMPGGVDVHTHFNIDTGLARSCDDFFTGTRAAAPPRWSTIWVLARLAAICATSSAFTITMPPIKR